MTAKTKDEGLRIVRNALEKAKAAEDVRGKVVAVFATSTSPWWLSPEDYLEYLVQQLITLFSYKFENERMSIPANMVYLMAAERGLPSILLHWRVYLSLYSPYVRGWRLETIKDENGKPIGMVAVIVDKEGNEWRWERYYDNHALTAKWKNKELMFAKTILKEALAIMFPYLNLLPPLSTVETYDPDDLVESARPPAPASPQASNRPDPEQIVQFPEALAQLKKSDAGGQKKTSSDVVRKLADTPPPDAKKERSGEAELSREILDKFQELSRLIGADEAKELIAGIVRDLGGEKFADLDTNRKKMALMMIDNAIFTEKKLKGEDEE
jgi:hypothetical protein